MKIIKIESASVMRHSLSLFAYTLLKASRSDGEMSVGSQYFKSLILHPFHSSEFMRFWSVDGIELKRSFADVFDVMISPRRN